MPTDKFQNDFFGGGIMKKIKVFILFGFIFFLVFIILGEIVLRLFEKKIQLMRPISLQKESLQYTSSLFVTHLFPQQEQSFVNRAWYSNEHGFPTYRVNEFGYRGKDFTVDKAPGTVRIVVYGGSAVFDLAMPEGKDWPHRVEQFLRQDGFNNVEVINAGVSGNTAYDSFGYLFAEGHQLRPDYVLLYSTWNDIKLFSNSNMLARTAHPYEAKNDPFLYYKNSVDKNLGEHLLLYSFLRYSFLKWKYRLGLEGAAPEKKVEYNIAQRALEQYKLNIQMFVDCARNIGATPILMTEGTLITKDNENVEKWRLRHIRNIMPYDFMLQSLEEAAKIIKSVAQEKNVDLIDAKELLVEKEEMLYFDHVHLGDAGSEELASIVKEHIKKILSAKGNNK